MEKLTKTHEEYVTITGYQAHVRVSELSNRSRVANHVTVMIVLVRWYPMFT
jgi:hypothetical protein